MAVAIRDTRCIHPLDWVAAAVPFFVQCGPLSGDRRFAFNFEFSVRFDFLRATSSSAAFPFGGNGSLYRFPCTWIAYPISLYLDNYMAAHTMRTQKAITQMSIISNVFPSSVFSSFLYVSFCRRRVHSLSYYHLICNPKHSLVCYPKRLCFAIHNMVRFWGYLSM